MPRLLAVPGVAKCSIFGGEVRQIQIQLRPDRLLAFDLSIQEVLEAARKATGVLGAGFIETPEQRINISDRGPEPDGGATRPGSDRATRGQECPSV